MIAIFKYFKGIKQKMERACFLSLQRLRIELMDSNDKQEDIVKIL